MDDKVSHCCSLTHCRSRFLARSLARPPTLSVSVSLALSSLLPPQTSSLPSSLAVSLSLSLSLCVFIYLYLARELSLSLFLSFFLSLALSRSLALSLSLSLTLSRAHTHIHTRTHTSSCHSKWLMLRTPPCNNLVPGRGRDRPSPGLQTGARNQGTMHYASCGSGSRPAPGLCRNAVTYRYLLQRFGGGAVLLPTGCLPTGYLPSLPSFPGIRMLANSGGRQGLLGLGRLGPGRGTPGWVARARLRGRTARGFA